MDAQSQRGEIICKGRDDILAKAINKPEQGGRVRAVGSGVTNKEYFGFNQPTPPNELRAKMVKMERMMVDMQNNHNLMMSFITTYCGLNPDQVRQFLSGFGGIGGQGSSASYAGFVSLLSGYGGQGLSGIGSGGIFSEGLDAQFGRFTTQGLGGSDYDGIIGQITSLGGQFGGGSTGRFGSSVNIGSGDAKASNDNDGDHLHTTTQPHYEDIEPYHVPWPKDQTHLDHEQNCVLSSYTRHKPSITHYSFPEVRNACSL